MQKTRGALAHPSEILLLPETLGKSMHLPDGFSIHRPRSSLQGVVASHRRIWEFIKEQMSGILGRFDISEEQYGCVLNSLHCAVPG